MARQTVTVRLYALNDFANILVINEHNEICRSAKPIERTLWWNADSLAYLRSSVERLLFSTGGHHIVVSLEFNPFLDPLTRVQPMPITLPMRDPVLTQRWIEAFLCRIDPRLWRELEERIAVATSVEVPPPPTTNGANHDTSIQHGEDHQ